MYRNPLRGLRNLRRLRVDQGVDFSGSGPIYAIGPALVTGVWSRGSSSSGWPGGGCVVYRLSDGAARGKFVFVAENIDPKVRVGQSVDSNTVVAILHDAPPNMEIGWASGKGTQSAVHGCGQPWNEDGHTSMGHNFNLFLRFIGAPQGFENAPRVGVLCPSFPSTWPAYPGHVLKEGMSEPSVGIFSRWLANHGFPRWRYGYVFSNFFGGGKVRAVKAFQKAHGITQDGEVGPRTWAVMFG